MAITFEGSETGTTDAGSGASFEVVTVNKPAGAAQDDLALAVICTDGNDAAGLPSGFTTWVDQLQSGSDFRLVVGFKILGASEPSSYDFTKDDGEVGVASISLFRSVNTSNPLDTSIATNQGNDAFPTSSSITTESVGSAVISVYGAEKGNMTPVTAPSGMTQFYSVNLGTGTTDAVSAGAWVIQASAGATGSKQWEVSDDDTWIALTIALKDASAATVVNVGIADETDTSLGVIAPIVVAAGLSSETDTSLGVTFTKEFPVGLSSETDQGRPITRIKTIAIGRANESDSAPALGAGVLAQLAPETDMALGVSSSKVQSIGLASETDAALTTTLGITVSLGLASETDTGRVLIEPITQSVGVAVEEDESLSRQEAIFLWPATLPQSLLLEGLRLGFVSVGFRRDMEAGPAYHRQVQTAGETPVNGNLWVTKAQFSTLLDFWENTLAHGTIRFRWKHPLTLATVDMQFLVDSPPTVLAREGTRLMVQLHMEILPDVAPLPGITQDVGISAEADESLTVTVA